MWENLNGRHASDGRLMNSSAGTGESACGGFGKPRIFRKPMVIEHVSPPFRERL